jgi:hypothetical protein
MEIVSDIRVREKNAKRASHSCKPDIQGLIEEVK